MTIDASGPNAEQFKHWNEVAGPKWVDLQKFIDEQIRPFGSMMMDKAGIGSGHRVLDVGCGCGDTTFEIARRIGPSGAVTGIDISGPMLQTARASARTAGVSNVTFEHADAQTAALPRQHFDVIFSRFGVMFFADPKAAFTNLRGALKPGGRLAFVCWRPLPENQWVMVPMSAIVNHVQLPPPPPPGAPGPFAFADADRVRAILTGAGFSNLEFDPVDRMMSIGGGVDLDATVGFLLQMGPTAVAVRDASDADRVKIAASVREVLLPHFGDSGVCLGGAVWLVTAR
jgi:SAM-dependent methyltransferase